MSEPRSAAAPQAARLADLLQRHPILIVWSMWSAVLLLLSASAIQHFRVQDPDDFLRLMQVRDLLAGQNWFDVTQYRMDPPHGAEMHWSRLVDLPIALALAVCRLFFAEPTASKAAMSLVPLGQLALVMLLMWRVMAQLGAGHWTRLIAIALIPLSPMLYSSFHPLRIDHHGWQAIAAFAAAMWVLRGDSVRAALAAGGVVALGLSISLELLPFVALLGALYGLRFVWLGEGAVAWFLTGLAGVSWISHLATRPASELLPHCDSVGLPHLAAFTVAAALAQLLVRNPGGSQRGDIMLRAVLLGAVGVIVAALIIAPIGTCAINPFATLDPLMRDFWHGEIKEGLPIHQQRPEVVVILLWAPPVTGLAIWSGLPGSDEGVAQRGWAWLAALTLGASLISVLVMRQSTIAGVLSVPFSALLIARYLPRARAIRQMLPRVLATVALPLLATPMLAGAAVAKVHEAMSGGTQPAVGSLGQPGPSKASDCNLASLASLPAAHLFATLDLGPEILVKTPHSIVASGYHRNMAKMREVVEAFSGDPAQAEAIVRANAANYLVLCRNTGDAATFGSRRPDNLTSALMKERSPDWLQPVEGFDRGVLRVYRVE